MNARHATTNILNAGYILCPNVWVHLGAAAAAAVLSLTSSRYIAANWSLESGSQQQQRP